jgi:hypothetical protein
LPPVKKRLDKIEAPREGEHIVELAEFGRPNVERGQGVCHFLNWVKMFSSSAFSPPVGCLVKYASEI